MFIDLLCLFGILNILKIQTQRMDNYKLHAKAKILTISQIFVILITNSLQYGGK